MMGFALKAVESMIVAEVQGWKFGRTRRESRLCLSLPATKSKSTVNMPPKVHSTYELSVLSCALSAFLVLQRKRADADAAAASTTEKAPPKAKAATKAKPKAASTSKGGRGKKKVVSVPSFLQLEYTRLI